MLYLKAHKNIEILIYYKYFVPMGQKVLSISVQFFRLFFNYLYIGPYVAQAR